MAALFAQPPNISPDGIVNSANQQRSIQPSAWISIYGTGLSGTTRAWSSADFVNGALPTALDGVSVTVGGHAAFVQYISPTQINVVLGPDTPTGPVAVTVTNRGATSAPAIVMSTVAGPGLFRLGAAGGRYPAALIDFADGSVKIAASDALYGRIEGVATAAQGQIISVYGTGFGPTRLAPPASSLFSGAYDLAASVTATIGGVSANVLFAGRVGPGLDQINIVIPAVPDGDYPIVLTVNAQVSQPDVFLSVGPGVNTSTPGIYNPIAKAQNTTVVLGDSISATTQDVVNEAWPSQLFIRSNAQVLKIGDAGVPGNTTAQMLARIQDVIALKPANCVLLGGTNDLILDLSTAMANIDQIAKTLQRNGIRPILSLIPPNNGQLGLVKATNSAIQAYAIANGFPFVDFFSVLADPATGNYLPGYSLDGIHPTPVAAEAMAKIFIDSARRFFMPVPSFLPAISQNGNNILAGSSFLKDSNSDGLADDWVITNGPGSLALLPDNGGFNWQSITSQGPLVQIGREYILAGPQTFSDGDRVAFVGRVKLFQPADGGGTGTLSLAVNQDNGATAVWPLNGWTTGIEDDTIYHEFTIPPHTQFINIFATAQGPGVNIQIAQPGLFNLSR
ncbi:MAG TPA: GDSL-type esterase/lipase family protein [Candidatus Acidoferrales bacterium]|nr:GDSL-type esterase/lipase family protein [Candidatus Acidoferrales bacterium]